MFRHKSFWIILLITAFVWLMATMTEHSDFTLSMPLRWEGFDNARYVVTHADTALPVSVHASYFQAVACSHAIRNQKGAIRVSGDSVLKVNSLLLSDLTKQFHFPSGVTVSSPVETLRITLAERRRKAFIPKLQDVDIRFADGRGLSGAPVIQPDTVWLYGNPASLDKISQITTDTCLLEALSDSGWHSIPLNKVWQRLPDLHASADSVRLFIPVERQDEKTLTIPVMPDSRVDNVNLRIIPARVTVTLWVPRGSYDLVTEQQLKAVATYSGNDLADQLPVRITSFPANTRIKQITPATVQYVVIKQP